MTNLLLQKTWAFSFVDFCAKGYPQSAVQRQASYGILHCKSGRFGYSVSQCEACNHIQIHSNSCRNRNCPNCQAVQKEVWVDKRRAEVIDAPYFHVVFTLPHALNALLYCNQKLLYNVFHKCCGETLLELSANDKWLGAMPGVIQVLHTWDQEMHYHVHMHCIVSGGGLTRDGKLRMSSKHFFIPTKVLRDKFKGKFMAHLTALYASGSLEFSSACEELRDACTWKAFKNNLYEKDWCPYIKETFNGFGNAIEYLGRYTHKIAISNRRILSVTETETTFSARGKKPGEPRRQITLQNTEFIRRFLMHVLPKGFQRIRYYGFLSNRKKAKNLQRIFTLQGRQRFRQKYAGLSMADLMKAVWNIDIRVCPACGCTSMRHVGRTHVLRC